MDRLSLDRARAVAAVTSDDLENISVAMTARGIEEEVRLVLRVGDGNVANETRSLLALGLIRDVHRIAASLIASMALGNDAESVVCLGDEAHLRFPDGRLEQVELKTLAEQAKALTKGRDQAAQEAGMQARVATQADLDGLTTTLTAAFRTDPLWSWAFPEPADLRVWWRFYISSALRHRCVWVLGDYAAASVWIPPNETELTEEEESRIPALLGRLIGGRAADVLELLESFEAGHPRDVPHYYLSLLGTHPDRRGRGFGMRLLAENLAGVDAEGLPAFLESSNPANNRRYERLGFRQIGEFTTPDRTRTVATMWRDGKSSSGRERFAANA